MSPISPEARAWLLAAHDHHALARVTRREEFVASCPFPFLFCRRERVAPAQPGRTAAISIAAPVDDPTAAQPLVYAVRKTQEAFPSMITVGRTRSSDIAIPDYAVSRFHAFFPCRAGAAELSIVDAGSHNGTFVDGERLPVNGPPTRLSLGRRVRFGRFTFLLVDAGTCWDALDAISSRRPLEAHAG